jgi:hypothetical protein
MEAYTLASIGNVIFFYDKAISLDIIHCASAFHLLYAYLYPIAQGLSLKL